MVSCTVGSMYGVLYCRINGWKCEQVCIKRRNKSGEIIYREHSAIPEVHT